MIATSVRVSYTCKNCAVPYRINYCSTGEVTELAKDMDRIKHCSICGRSMNIVNAIFKVMENIYGDYIGQWSCPVHTGLTYWPSLLRKVAANELKMVTVGENVYNRYTKVISRGYPWKCPTCGIPMRYSDE